MRIKYSNMVTQGKSLDELIKNSMYKREGSRSNVNDKEYLEIIRKTIPEKLERVPFQDMELKPEELEKLLEEFDREIKRLLSEMDSSIKRNEEYMFRGRRYKLNARNEDWHIVLAMRTYSLIEECLQNKEPLYLSITEEE